MQGINMSPPLCFPVLDHCTGQCGSPLLLARPHTSPLGVEAGAPRVPFTIPTAPAVALAASRSSGSGMVMTSGTFMDQRNHSPKSLHRSTLTLYLLDQSVCVRLRRRVLGLVARLLRASSLWGTRSSMKWERFPCLSVPQFLPLQCGNDNSTYLHDIVLIRI